MESGAGDDTNHEGLDAQLFGQQQRAEDDREVVEHRRDGGQEEVPAGVQDAGQHAADGEEDGREEQHSGEEDGVVDDFVLDAGVLAEARGERRDDPLGREEDGDGQCDRAEQDPVEDDAGQSPGGALATVLQHARVDGDEGRGEGGSGQELEDEIGQAHRDPEGVELDGRTELFGDHRCPRHAEQSRAEERDADQQHRADDAATAAEESSG